MSWTYDVILLQLTSLTRTEERLHLLNKVLSHQISVLLHLCDSVLIVAGYRHKGLTIVPLIEHVTNPNGVHHYVRVVAKVPELVVVVPRVEAAICDHHDRYPSTGSLAVSNQVVIGKFESRGRERAPCNPLQILHCRFKGGQGVYGWVVKANSLKGPFVTELYNSNSCA